MKDFGMIERVGRWREQMGKRRLRRRASVGVVVGLFGMGTALWMSGCGSARKGEPLVIEKRVPSAAVAAGQVTFMRYCNQCHPGGSAGLGPALNNKPLPGGLIKTQVRVGGGAMPAFGKERISDAELDGVVEYLKWLRGLETDGGETGHS